MTAQQAWNLIVEYQWIAWFAAFAIINLLLRFRTIEGWVAFCERAPRVASFFRLLRAVGIDPAKAAEAIVGIVTGKARIPATLATPAASTAPEIIPPPPRAPIITQRD